MSQIEHPGHTRLYFTTGHGEIDLSNERPSTGYHKLLLLLQDLDLQVTPVHLSHEKVVLEDHSILVIANPQKDFADSELELVSAYTQRGNGLLLLGGEVGAEGKQYLNSLTSRLCGVLLKSNSVSVPEKWAGRNFRDRYNYKIQAHLGRDAFLKPLQESHFEVIADEQEYIVRLKAGRDYPFEPVEELHRLYGEETGIEVLPPASPTPGVAEVTPDSNHEIFTHPEQVTEIEYAFGCSLDCNAAFPGLTVLLRSPESSDPGGEPLCTVTEMREGKIIILGSCAMFANDEGFGLFSLSNSYFLRNTLRWLLQPVMNHRSQREKTDSRLALQSAFEKTLQEDFQDQIREFAEHTRNIAKVQADIKRIDLKMSAAERNLTSPAASGVSTLYSQKMHQQSFLSALERKKHRLVSEWAQKLTSVALDSEAE